MYLNTHVLLIDQLIEAIILLSKTVDLIFPSVSFSLRFLSGECGKGERTFFKLLEPIRILAVLLGGCNNRPCTREGVKTVHKTFTHFRKFSNFQIIRYENMFLRCSRIFLYFLRHFGNN